MNYGIVLHVIGWVLKFEALSMILPLICAMIYGEKDCLNIFLICIIICLAFGTLLSYKKPKSRTMYAKEGFVTVSLSWIFLSIFGALPFFLSQHIPSFIDALFETVSGFTTTGASILTNVEILPKSLIFWRSFSHWIGGMGVLVFLMAILPLSESSNIYLMKAESPGPAVSKLVPHVRKSAGILYLIYLAMTFLEIILLVLGDMNPFAAITLSFGTAGTGGFAILNSGIASYTSYQQVVITIFMLLFGVDFSVYYLLILKKSKQAFSMEEPRYYFAIVFMAIALITANCMHLFGGFWETLKHSAFQVASIITTTGYATYDFNMWPEFSKTILLCLMFIGACAGSTGGGMKVARIVVLAKTVIKEIKIAVHPKMTLKTTMNGRPVMHETVRGINVFFVSYFLIFFLSLLVLSIDKMNFTTNFTAVAATINNIGPGLSAVGPYGNYAAFSFLSKLVLIFNMLLGRLEIFPLLVLFSRTTWKK